MFMSVAKQEQPVGDHWRAKNATTFIKWQESVAKTQGEAVDRIVAHRGTQLIVNSRIYPSPLRYTPRGYLDHAFPFYTDPSASALTAVTSGRVQPPVASGGAPLESSSSKSGVPVRSGG